MIANISLAYQPQVHSFQPMVTHAGIEYLTVAFPLTKYPGHLMVGAAVRPQWMFLPHLCRVCRAFDTCVEPGSREHPCRADSAARRPRQHC